MSLYECEFPGCDMKSKIRNKVKDKTSEHYGKLVCGYHATMLRRKQVSEKSKRTQEKRKEQRKDYPEFYKKHIECASKRKCQECGKPLQGNSTEVVHVLAKSTSPEVAVNDLNIIYLCQPHHSQYDSSLEKRATMDCMKISTERYIKLKPLLKKHTSETLFFEEFIEKFA